MYTLQKKTGIAVLLLGFVLSFESCFQDKPGPAMVSTAIHPLSPPVVIAASGKVTILDTCPKPISIAIPENTGGSYSINTQQGIETFSLSPPETVPVEFIVPIQNFGQEDGLAMPTISSSCTDKKGNLWFGTFGAGLSRYDGNEFTNYTVSQGLINNGVSYVTEDRKGNIWIGSYEGGVSCFNGKSFINYTVSQGLASNIINCITEDKKGNIWFGTQGSGVSCFDGKTFRTYSGRDGLLSNNVISMVEDDLGQLWLGTDSGISRFDGGRFTSFPASQGITKYRVQAMAFTRDGKLWLGTVGGGVNCFDGKEFINYSTAQGLAGNSVSRICEDKNGNLWIGTWGGGVSRLEMSDKSIKNFTTKQGLKSNIINSVVEDKDNNMWFGTGNGLSRLDNNNKSKKAAIAVGFMGGFTPCAYEDKNREIWFGEYKGALLRLNPDEKGFKNYSFKQGLPNRGINTMAGDRKGNIWIGTQLGLCRLDSSRKYFTRYDMSHGLPGVDVISILEDKHGNLWCGTRDGVCRFDPDRKSVTSYSTSNGLPNNTVHNIIEDHSGNIWFATTGGISFYNGKSLNNYTTAEGLLTNRVTKLFEDLGDNLWVGTERGLLRFDSQRKSFLHYSSADGLADEMITDILMDKAGLIWLGTNKGLVALTGFAQDLNNEMPGSMSKNLSISNTVLNNELIKQHFKPVFETYNYSSGYPIKDVAWHGGCISGDGSIWVGSGQSIVNFSYSSIHKQLTPPEVFIRGIKIDNTNLSWHGLAHDTAKAKGVIIAANITDEVTVFKKELSADERNSLQEKYGDIKFDSVRRFNPVPVNPVLPYKHNTILFDFAVVQFTRSNLVQYQYMLAGFDKDWSPLSTVNSATFGNVPEGRYTFKVKALSPDGIWGPPLLYDFRVLPPWYRTWWAYSLYIILFLAVLWAFIKWRIGELKKEKQVLEEKVFRRTHELREEKEKVESTLAELKATQAQLIQSEKMASLGELTAGIAHEIQNPLNFVNNFSELNSELIDELMLEIKNGNIDDITLIAGDIKENEQKINHHGKRADAIVKGMLQHSLSNNGNRELSDINVLASEYFKLSYHGIRAKDKSFNANMHTSLDEEIGKINIVPQDIGRALLNLFNNSFYAVGEMKKRSGNGYEPTVSLSTKKLLNKIEIRIRDNGIGIPQNILNKIFQPFYTTKPTGQGTGLGLSLTYDIITKEHDGQLQVVTQDGKGAEFIIILPVNDLG